MTEDIAKILNIKKEEVIIVFQEAPHGNWYSSGVRLYYHYICYVDNNYNKLIWIRRITNDDIKQQY